MVSDYMIRRESVHRLLVAVLSVSAGTAQDSLPQSAFSVIEKNCLACHGAAKTSGLDLRTRDTALAGGQHGRVIVPSNPGESRLFRMVSHTLTPSMPPGGKLSDEDIETLREWIAAGASYE